MPKHLILSAIILASLITPSFGQDTNLFSLKHYGHFKKMMHMKKTDGVVNLEQIMGPQHLYGVGAPAHGTGEITLLDGELWLDYGKDGLGNAKHKAAKDEQAVILVTSIVQTWRDISIPRDMTAVEMHDFILTQAASIGIANTSAFPFMLDGKYFNLDWHVLNGLKVADGSNSGAHNGIYNKVKEHLAEAAGNIVGFYSAANQGVYTHPGESWHQHLIIKNAQKTGHIDGFAVRKGTILKLPIN